MRRADVPRLLMCNDYPLIGSCFLGIIDGLFAVTCERSQLGQLDEETNALVVKLSGAGSWFGVYRALGR